MSEEQVGAEAKFWLQSKDERYWLFKPVRYWKNGERRDLDVAEKVAAEIAGLLDLPHATAELATRNGEEGVISRDVRPGGDDLFSLRDGADQLLDIGAEGFAPSASLGPKEKKLRPGHSLPGIESALRDVVPPEGCAAGLTAFDVFAGYLLFDAWIGNADRHDQNWAVLEPLMDLDAKRALSPTYDHGSALGSSVDASQRRSLADDAGRMQRFAERGRATSFENTGKDAVPTLVALAAEALRRCSPQGTVHWNDVAGALPVEAARTVVTRVPGMSEGTRRFTIRLLETNARRIRDGCHGDT